MAVPLICNSFQDLSYTCSRAYYTCITGPWTCLKENLFIFNSFQVLSYTCSRSCDTGIIGHWMCVKQNLSCKLISKFWVIHVHGPAIHTSFCPAHRQYKTCMHGGSLSTHRCICFLLWYDSDSRWHSGYFKSSVSWAYAAEIAKRPSCFLSIPKYGYARLNCL